MIKRIIFPDLAQKISQSPNFRNAMNLKQHRTIVQMLFYCRIIVLFLAISCSDDDNGPDLREPFIGTYQVDEFIPPATTVSKSYEITISKGTGQDLKIGNFPGFFVPWKATVNGNTLTITQQSLTAGSATVTASGGGTFDNDILDFSYKIEGFANYDRDCVAIKK